MAETLTISKIKDSLRMWSKAVVPVEMQSLMIDHLFIDTINSVKRDMNNKFEIHIERYNKDTTSGTTNYVMQGDIVKVYYFKYVHDDWKDQRWTNVNSVIVLKEDPASSSSEMDIIYLRDVSEIVDADTDEIDIPRYAIYDFLELLKCKILVDLGIKDITVYLNQLQFIGSKIRMSRQNNPIDQVKTLTSWSTEAESTNRYDITDQWVSQDSVATFDSGDIIFI